MAIHIMGDLETLSTTHSAAVVQMGFVSWDSLTNNRHTFKRNISFDDAMRHGEVSGDTLAWWFKQSDEARESITDKELLVSSEEAVGQLEEFLKGVMEKSPRHVHFWSHASFDAPILVNLFKSHGKEFPIPFYKFRDLRTIDYLACKVADKIPREGTHHDALDDAQYQMDCLIDKLQKVKEKLEWENSDV